MNAFIVLVAVVAAASANPQVLWNHGVWPNTAITYNAASVVPAYNHVVAPLATKTQYHAQDEFGQASYGYAHAGQAHAEVRDAAGNVRGSYAYINPNGKEVRVAYTAGHDGFRVASNDLPIAPVDHNVPAIANLVAPRPVQETPEVIQARAAHAVAHQEALARAGRAKRHVLTSAVVPTTALGYSNVWNNAYTTPLVSTAYNTPVVSSAYTAPVAYTTGYTGYSTPLVSGYSTPLVSGYSTPVVSNVVAHQAVREATLTKVHNNPGHAVSYRVD